MKQKILLLASLALLLGACEPTVANRGNILDTEKLNEIKVGTSTREEVATKLGTPTQISTFDDKKWYYIGRQTEQYSFLDPEVIDQQATEISFDDQGVVTSINKLDVASAAADVAPVDRRTPTYGSEVTLVKQLLGNLARPMPKMNQRRSGQ